MENTATTTNNTNRQAPNLDDDEEMDDDAEQLEEKLAEDVASFDEFTVWDHEAVPAAAEDPYAIALEEWIALAEAVSQIQYEFSDSVED